MTLENAFCAISRVAYATAMDTRLDRHDARGVSLSFDCRSPDFTVWRATACLEETMESFGMPRPWGSSSFYSWPGEKPMRVQPGVEPARYHYGAHKSLRSAYV